MSKMWNSKNQQRVSIQTIQITGSARIKTKSDKNVILGKYGVVSPTPYFPQNTDNETMEPLKK